MTLSFNIESNCDCNITITNTTSISEYLQATNKTTFNSSNLPFSESRCVVRLVRIDVNGEKTSSEAKVMDVRQATFTNMPDGWYKLEAILLPTKSYLDKMKSSWNTNFYYVDNKDFYMYDSSSKSGTKVSNIDNLFTYLENNSKEDFQKSFFSFGFITDYFSLCHLYKCYINRINNVFSSLCGLNLCETKLKNKEEIYLRDLLLTSIDIISYLVQCGRFEEANRILNQIFKCNGLCNNSPNALSKRGGCGCSPDPY